MNQFKGDKRTKEYKQWLKDNPEGLGDTIEKITKATGIKKLVEKFTPKGKECGCNERKEKLNKMFPYRLKSVRCLTEDEQVHYKAFKENRTLRLNNDEIKFVCKLYSEIFNKLYYEPPKNSSLKPVYRMIEALDKVYESYEKEIKQRSEK